MRKLFYTAAAAAMVLGSTAATAAPIVLAPAPAVNVPLTPPVSGNFGNSFNPATVGLFTDVYNFTLTSSSLGSAFLGSISLNAGNNIDFTCQGCGVRLDGIAFTPGSAGIFDTFTLPPTLLAGTAHNFTVTGNIVSGPTAAYTGSFNFNVASVPEPATWGMMLLGFLGIGMVVRRSRRPVLAQVA